MNPTMHPRQLHVMHNMLYEEVVPVRVQPNPASRYRDFERQSLSRSVVSMCRNASSSSWRRLDAQHLRCDDLSLQVVAEHSKQSDGDGDGDGFVCNGGLIGDAVSHALLI